MYTRVTLGTSKYPSKMPCWHAFHPHNSMSHNGSTSTRMISRKIYRNPSANKRSHAEWSSRDPPAPTNSNGNSGSNCEFFLFFFSEGKMEGLCHWPALDHMQNLHVAPPRHQSTFHLQLLVVQRAEEASHPLETWALGGCWCTKGSGQMEKQMDEWRIKSAVSSLGVIFTSFWYRNLQVEQEFMFPFAFAFIKIAEVWIVHEQYRKVGVSHSRLPRLEKLIYCDHSVSPEGSECPSRCLEQI